MGRGNCGLAIRRTEDLLSNRNIPADLPSPSTTAVKAGATLVRSCGVQQRVRRLIGNESLLITFVLRYRSILDFRKFCL